MSKIIACCGLICTECPAFIATQTDDDNARKKTADYYKKNYGFTLNPEEINCDGCHSSGENLIAYCKTCEIRECCQDKALEHCALCAEQPCEKLSKLHDFSPTAKDRFCALKKQLGLN